MIIALLFQILLATIAPDFVRALFLLAFVGGMLLLGSAQAHAMEFTGTCHGAGEVVTSFDGFDTDHATITGVLHAGDYTVQDNVPIGWVVSQFEIRAR